MGMSAIPCSRLIFIPWLCGHEIFNKIIQNSKQRHHRWMSLLLWLSLARSRDKKATNYVRNLNVTRACRDISISVLAKRFSFVIIVILLHTLVKIVWSHRWLFVRLLFLFSSSFYFCYHSRWIKIKDVYQNDQE